MIQINDLTFQYKKEPPLFDQLSVELKAGSITGLLGKNGAGKTTLLKLLVGLLQPHGGAMTIDGRNPQDRSPDLLSRVFFVPEEFYLPPVKMRSYISANSSFYPNFDHAMLDGLLKEFELPTHKSIQKMSYGQKKKFLISFALSTRCELLVLDEPTNGLDIPSKSIFRKVVASSLGEDQLLIISTHQVKDIENLIDKIIMLSNGKVILEKDLFEISEQLEFATSSSPEEDKALYSEIAPGGYRVIRPRVNGDTPVDIELLFNAIMQGKNLFK